MSTWCKQNKREIPKIIEDANTFEENSLIKAKAVYNITKQAVVADDTGLVVPALSGEPGIYSARYAFLDNNEKESDSPPINLPKEEIYRLNRKKLLKKLEDINDKRAYFICVMTLITEKGQIFQGIGKCEGVIGTVEQGIYGFGYDPIFVVKGLKKTFAELTTNEKNSISHRSLALRNVFECFTKNNF